MGERESYEAGKEAAREVTTPGREPRYAKAMRTYLRGEAYPKVRRAMMAREPARPADEPVPRLDNDLTSWLSIQQPRGRG